MMYPALILEAACFGGGGAGSVFLEGLAGTPNRNNGRVTKNTLIYKIIPITLAEKIRIMLHYPRF